LVQFPGEPRESVADALGEVLRQGARKMLAEAIEAEVAEYLKSRKGLHDEAGRSSGGGAQRSPAGAEAADAGG
jgi:hypothetical protein